MGIQDEKRAWTKTPGAGGRKVQEYTPNKARFLLIVLKCWVSEREG